MKTPLRILTRPTLLSTMRASCLLVATVTASFCWAIPHTAHADDASTRRMVARKLFDEGRELMRDGNLAEACPKLAESLALHRGGGTLLNLALCHERSGRTATAWLGYKEALTMAQRDNNPSRVAFATEHIAALEPKLSYVTIQVEESSRVSDLEVTFDGTPLGHASWGTALPADPGTHLVRASAPSRRPWEHRFELKGPSERQSVAVPVLELIDAPNVVGATEPSTPAKTQKEHPAPPATSEAAVDTGTEGSSFWKTACIGSGATLLGVGAVASIVAWSKKSSVDDQCDGKSCYPEAEGDWNTANDWATVGTVGVVGGGLLLAAGLFLIPSDSAQDTGPSVSVGVGPGGARVGGQWRF